MRRVLLVRERDGVKRYNVDLVGRKVIVAAFLYYMLDTPSMSDAQYDRMSQFVADYWDQLSPDRQWCMRDPDQTRASGSHFRFTSLAASAALNRYKYITGEHLGWHPDMEWRKRKRDGCSYITLSAERPVPLARDHPARDWDYHGPVRTGKRPKKKRRA